jgi:phage terminase large subunit GpA-like protein
MKIRLNFLCPACDRYQIVLVDDVIFFRDSSGTIYEIAIVCPTCRKVHYEKIEVKEVLHG